MLFILSFIAISCSENFTDNNEPVQNNLYFPEIGSDQWESSTPEELLWNLEAIETLYDFLEENNTRAFIVLKDGKIVLENYWGNNILNTAPFDIDSRWYWASAGKSLTAFLVGIAQANGLLDIEESSSYYLGNGWSSLNQNQENQIKIKHHLTMTTGLDYQTTNLDCTDPNCLNFKNSPGTNWFYHNAAYTLLDQVIENASQTSFNSFSNENLETKIGMSGNWIQANYNNIYWSTARDMARFGLLVLNEGAWKEKVILENTAYFTNMTSTSQQLNESYGYLWWLNGKDRIILPGFSFALNTSLATNAPEDLIAALGKNGQCLDVIPSQNLVVVRMGEAEENTLVSANFHNEMWQYLQAILF